MELINMFGMDMKPENDGKIDGQRFLIRQLDAETAKKQKALDEDFSVHEKKSTLPFWARIVEWACFLFGAICVMGFLKALTNVSFETAWGNGGGILIVGLGLLAVAFVLYRIEKKKDQTVVKSDDFQRSIQDAAALRKEILEKLNVPADAATVDVFGYPYKEKHGKRKDAGMMSKYINVELLLFREKDNLCLADVGSVFAVPLDKIEKIVKINKRAMTTNWNKETAFDKGEYKQYKLTANQYGSLFVKPYYSIRFISEGFEYEILVPCYDIQPFLDMTGLMPEEEEKKKD